jgi:hypothetical protein
MKAMLDKLVAITEYHSRSVLRALNRKHPNNATDVGQGPPARHHRCVYDPEVVAALVPLW